MAENASVTDIEDENMAVGDGIFDNDDEILGADILLEMSQISVAERTLFDETGELILDVSRVHATIRFYQMVLKLHDSKWCVICRAVRCYRNLVASVYLECLRDFLAFYLLQ